MIDIASRNRAIKKALEQAFGCGKVRVRGSRGSGYGWVHVNIDHQPLDIDQAQELQRLCFQLLRAARIELGRTYTDDTCQHESSMCTIHFEPCRYWRTHRASNGKLWAQNRDTEQWEEAAA